VRLHHACLLGLALHAVPAHAGGPELGIRADAVLFLIDRGPAVLPGGQIELGYVPSLLDGRLRLALVWGAAGIEVHHAGDDAQLRSPKDDEELAYRGSILLNSVHLGVEIGARLLPFSSRASPYVVWRPRVMLMRTATELGIGTLDLARVEEWKWFLTVEGGLGVEIRAGGGQVFAELAAGLFPLDNETVGNATGLSLVASLGYRQAFMR
jgi:hypothetical protein